MKKETKYLVVEFIKGIKGKRRKTENGAGGEDAKKVEEEENVGYLR